MWQVVGQPRAVALLERSLEKGRLSHAYLFIGPPHVGKLTLALNLAQALNCEREVRPCVECNSCRRIATNKHPDVQIIGLASKGRIEIGIDQIRDMQIAASLPPFEGKYKTFIIEGAEHLSPEAANCLLKILEEPLPQVVLILLTARERLLLPTVASRCQQVELHPLPSGAVKEILTQQYKVEEQKAEVVARLSRGCLGWALSVIQDGVLLQERSQRLASLIDLSHAQSGQRLSYAAELALEFSKSRSQVDEVLSVWLSWWRDLLLIKGGNSQSITNIDYKSELFHQAEGYSLKRVRDFLHHLQATREQLEQNANPRLALEALMLSMPRYDKS